MKNSKQLTIRACHYIKNNPTQTSEIYFNTVKGWFSIWKPVCVCVTLHITNYKENIISIDYSKPLTKFKVYS